MHLRAFKSLDQPEMTFRDQISDFRQRVAAMCPSMLPVNRITTIIYRYNEVALYQRITDERQNGVDAFEWSFV